MRDKDLQMAKRMTMAFQIAFKIKVSFLFSLSLFYTKISN